MGQPGSERDFIKNNSASIQGSVAKGQPLPPMIPKCGIMGTDSGAVMTTACYWCYECVGEVLKGSREYYLRNDLKVAADQGIRQSYLCKQWNNFRQAAMGRITHNDDYFWHFCGEITVNKSPNELRASVAQTWAALQKAPVLAAAADYVCKLGPNTYVLYCCAHCGYAPTNPAMWLRTSTNSARW